MERSQTARATIALNVWPRVALARGECAQPPIFNELNAAWTALEEETAGEIGAAALSSPSWSWVPGASAAAGVEAGATTGMGLGAIATDAPPIADMLIAFLFPARRFAARGNANGRFLSNSEEDRRSAETTKM